MMTKVMERSKMLNPKNQKARMTFVNRAKVAERVGFEPTVPCGTPDFESGTFDHSATSPENGCMRGQRRSPQL
jgi:hypothetical protein